MEQIFVAIFNSNIWTALFGDLPPMAKAVLIGAIVVYVGGRLSIKDGKLTWGSREQANLELLAEMSMEILKNTIYSNQPWSEKAVASAKFIARGGNGDVKKYINETIRAGNEERYDDIAKIVNKKR